LNLFRCGVTADALRAKIDGKSAISLQRGHIDPKRLSESLKVINFGTNAKPVYDF